MTPPGNLPAYAYAGIALLVAWRIFMRVRRLVGRQRLRTWRLWLTLGVFPLLVLTLLAGSLRQPQTALAELAGVGVGIFLGLQGLRLTRYESTPAGLYYTPSAHIGIALSLLMFARLAYRGVQLYALSAALGEPPTSFARSPLTLLIFGTLAGYYATYAWGLLRWQRSLRQSAPVAPPAIGPG